MRMLSRRLPWVLAFGAVIALSTAGRAQESGQMTDAELAEAGEIAPGQLSAPEAASVQPTIAQTTLTFRSHAINSGASAGNLEGNACPAAFTMISGACHPGYSDGVVIINQFPNRSANTWRCGFKNNTGTSRTVWIYTLCGQ